MTVFGYLNIILDTYQKIENSIFALQIQDLAIQDMACQTLKVQDLACQILKTQDLAILDLACQVPKI